jgi:putative transposase
VDHLQRVLGISQRLACRIVGQHRSTQRHQPTAPERDRALRQQLRAFSRAHPRWGYRRAHAQLLHQGWVVNRKAIQRLWREEGLRVPAQRRKRQRLGTSTTPADRLAAEHPDHVWRWTTSSTRPRTAGG